MKPYCSAACFSCCCQRQSVVNCFLGFLFLLFSATSTPFVESLPSPTQPSAAAIYSLYNTAVPVNVSARPLSSTAAVVSWTLTRSITVIAANNNNNNGSSSSINDGGEEAAAASDQQQQQSTAAVAVNSSNANDNAISSIPIRLEITYKPIQDRQKMVVAVPPQISSYILSDLKPGNVYTVSVTSIGKGHRSKSAPVQLVMMPRQLPSPPPPPSAHLNSPFTSTRRPPPPPPPPPNYPASNGRTIINYTDYYSNNLFPKQNHPGIASSANSGTATVAAAGVVYVRPEEIGIVILVLLVWVAAVGLFFHRWGKIRMLLPYQPVFKEEEPVIVAACSPSPTLQRMMSSSSQDQQQQMGMGCSQQSSPSPAVLVSANKFVSLDPAAIRRNQFKLHSRLARMQAYGDRRPWPSTSRGGLLEYSVSSSMGSRTMIRAQGATTPAAARRAFATNARRANTIAIEDPANPSCCPACRCPQQSQQQQSPLLGHQGHNSHLQQQQHHHHLNSGAGNIHHSAAQTNIIKSGRFQQQPMHNRRDYLHRLHHFHPAVQLQSSGSSDDQFPVPFDQQQQPRKAVSAEVITLTVTECCETAENTSSSSSSTSPVGSDKGVRQSAAALQASFAVAAAASTASTNTTTSTTSSSSSPTVISVDDATIIHIEDEVASTTESSEAAAAATAIKTSPEKVVDIVNSRTPIESTL